MTGFRKFLLGGGLVPTAVAFIMGGAFGTVVTAFVTIIMDLIGKLGDSKSFSSYHPGGVHVGAFITALISFIVVAAVVYFAVVKPYAAAKDRFFPDPEPGETELDVLKQIRDGFAAGGGTGKTL